MRTPPSYTGDMASDRINLADPDFEPTDEQLQELSRRAFAGIREERARSLAEMHERIALESRRLVAELHDRFAELGAARASDVKPT